MTTQTGYRLVIARPAWFIGDLAAVENSVVIGSPERALHVIQGLLRAAHVRWVSGKQEGQILDLKTYASRFDAADEEKVEMRDCAIYLEETTVY